MRFWLFSILMVWSASAQPAELTKIERRLTKEPVYHAKPKYCLLVFGPEAKTRVWLVIDGDTFYVDRNANGDITEKDERVDLPKYKQEEDSSSALIAGQREAKAGSIHDGRFLHTDLEITQARLNLDYKPKDSEEESFKRSAESLSDGILYAVSLTVDSRCGRGKAQFAAVADTQGFLSFAERPENAPLIHFDGPLQMSLQPMQKLLHGDKPTELHSWVGTPGMGAGTFASLVYVTNPGLVPKDSHPVAEIEFPGEKSLRTSVVLKERC